MNFLSRREMIVGGIGAAAGGGVLLDSAPADAAANADFTFVHITDTHIQMELGAKAGVHQAFNMIKALPQKPAFALVGGDVVMDAAESTQARADNLYALWRQEAAGLGLRMYYSIGNHDIYGVYLVTKEPNNPELGKKIWKRRLGLDRTYDTFDHSGWRFITLDSIEIGPKGGWAAGLDDDQLKWLDTLLRKTPKTMPIVFLTHCPIFTIFGQYTGGTTTALPSNQIVYNGKVFFEHIQGYNVKAVFQGHTHVVEEVNYLGTRYITGGAVCGNWWTGPRLGVHPEGFVVAKVTGGDLSWKYATYGWKARKA